MEGPSGPLPELRLPVVQLQAHDVDAEAHVVLAGGPGEVRGGVVAPVVAVEGVPAVDPAVGLVAGNEDCGHPRRARITSAETGSVGARDVEYVRAEVRAHVGGNA